MEQERANWCRFAQLTIKIGCKVLRRFFLLECLTSIFTNYYDHWNSQVHNPGWIAYSCLLYRKLNVTPKNSAQSAAEAPYKLLTSWSERGTKACTLMEETNRLQQWLNDIENVTVGNASEGVRDTLQTWSSQIQKKMEQLNSMNTILRRWDAIFLDNLFGAQVRLQTEIENQDVLLSNRIKELKSLNNPSRRDLQQVIQKFKSDLDTLKMNCTRIFQAFEDDCCTLIAAWENEVPGCIEDTQDCAMLITFLTKVRQKLTKKEKATSQACCLCNNRYKELLTLYNIKEEETTHCNLASEISKLVKELCEKIERLPSFKESLFTDCIKEIISSTERPRLAKPQISVLKDISSSTGLETVDNSLLIAMLQRSKFVHSKVHSGDEDLPDWDTSISADILRLRSHRDNIVAHATQAKISSDRFDQLWREATVLFCRIAARCGSHFKTSISKEIDQMKFLPLEPEREFRLWQEIVEWCQKDISVQLSTTSPGSSLCLELLNIIKKVPLRINTIKQDPRVFVCSNCQTEFTETCYFLDHKCKKDPEWYECKKCKKKTSTENELLCHTCKQDPTMYVCRNCKQEFSTKWSFSEHRCTRVGPMN